jgi:TRAP-type mannitol/chloroaromatic compound transport system permease small subunit
MTQARLIGGLDRLVAAILSAGRWLLLPVVALLFLQWPLREFVRSYSREANDLGQWLFALFVAMAFTAATRAHTHLAADAVARNYSDNTRAWIARLGALFGLLPWALFVLIAGAKLVVPSLQAIESFPDTTNPGYFIIKLALWLLAGLILMQAVIDILRPRQPDPRQESG